MDLRVFANEVWERHPHAFGTELRRVALDDSLLFEALQTATASYRKRDHTSPVRVRFWIEDALVQTEVERFLPNDRDSSFGGYADRLSAVLGGRRFGLMLKHLQLYSRETWSTLRSFARELYGHTGLPLGFADADILFGNYRATPFGVHQDAASNFTFVIQGNKTILAWPPDSMVSRAGSFQGVRPSSYLPYREDAIVLEAAEGEAVYWPSSHWHIAEGGPSCALSVQLAFYHSPSPIDFVTEAIRSCLLPGWVSALSRDSDLTPRVDALLHQATSQLAAPSLTDDIFAACLNHVSGDGFRPVPTCDTDRSIHPSLTYRGRRGLRFTSVARSNCFHVSVHGRSRKVPSTDGVRELLQALNAGRAVLAADATSCPHAMDLLLFFFQLRGVESCNVCGDEVDYA